MAVDYTSTIFTDFTHGGSLSSGVFHANSLGNENVYFTYSSNSAALNSAVNFFYEGSPVGSSSYAGYYLNNFIEYPLIEVNSTYYLLGQANVSTQNYNITSAAFDQLTLVCYLRGTLIMTEVGEVTVENLRPGDRVVTRFGGVSPVRWVGRRSFDARFLRGKGDEASSNLPVRIKAGALGDNTPVRDLLVSPSHAMLIGDRLVGAAYLVNGISIVREVGLDRVDYFHIDLGEHDCVLAEGAWSESYAELENRSWFANAGEYDAFYHEETQGPVAFCAPRLEEDDPELPALIGAVLARLPADTLAYDADLHLLVDGARIEGAPGGEGETRFRLPEEAKEVRLACRTVRPFLMGLGADRRNLGYAVHALLIEGQGRTRRIAGDDPWLGEGFHPFDGEARWTTGSARLPAVLFQSFEGEVILTVQGQGAGRYLAPPQQRDAA